MALSTFACTRIAARACDILDTGSKLPVVDSTSTGLRGYVTSSGQAACSLLSPGRRSGASHRFCTARACYILGASRIRLAQYRLGVGDCRGRAGMLPRHGRLRRPPRNVTSQRQLPPAAGYAGG